MSVEEVADDARNVAVVHRSLLQIGGIGGSSSQNLSMLKFGLFSFRFDLELIVSGQVIVAAGHSDGRQLGQKFEGVEIWTRFLSRILFRHLLVMIVRFGQVLVDIVDAETSVELHLILNEILEVCKFRSVRERCVSGVEKLQKMLDGLDADVGKNQTKIFLDRIIANLNKK